MIPVYPTRRMFFDRSAVARRSLLLLVATCSLVMVPRLAAAQAVLGDMRRQASRSELEKMAEASETAAQTAADAKLRDRHLASATTIRQRLRAGDFGAGDRVLVQVLGDTAFSDTFTVRADRSIQFSNLPDVSVSGVLDSELAAHLKRSLAKYLRNIEVTTTALVRVVVIGAVGRPGFYTVPADQSVTDLLTVAGLSSGSDFTKIFVRRSGREHIGRKDMQAALAAGKTVGDLALRDGDQIHVPLAPTGVSRWQQAAGIIGALGGLIWIIRGGFGRGF